MGTEISVIDDTCLFNILSVRMDISHFN